MAKDCTAGIIQVDVADAVRAKLMATVMATDQFRNSRRNFVRCLKCSKVSKVCLKKGRSTFHIDSRRCFWSIGYNKETRSYSGFEMAKMSCVRELSQF